MPGEAETSSRIFISYRREDSSGHVLALLPSLRSHFGADRIFKDTDNIPPGADFLKFIKSELETCSVLLAIIGREWLTIQDPRLKRRRLDNPDDFLRVEVATALKNERIRVIPILIERAPMPAAQDLPSDLAELSFRNAVELSDGRWESDVRLLIEAIEHAVADSVAKPQAPTRPGLQDVQKRRAREIASQLANARQAFESGDFEGTLYACDKALLLDPQMPDVLALLDRARKALDEQKINAWLEDARRALGQGDIGKASDLIDQALAVDRDSKQALTIRGEMLELRRERERERDRARTVQAAIDRARASFEEGDFEAAVRNADDALADESGELEALSLKSKALAALDERRRQRDLKRRAQQTVSDARAKFAAGQHQDALALLREFSPEQELVSAGASRARGRIRSDRGRRLPRRKHVAKSFAGRRSRHSALRRNRHWPRRRRAKTRNGRRRNVRRKNGRKRNDRKKSARKENGRKGSAAPRRRADGGRAAAQEGGRSTEAR